MSNRARSRMWLCIGRLDGALADTPTDVSAREKLAELAHSAAQASEAIREYLDATVPA